MAWKNLLALLCVVLACFLVAALFLRPVSCEPVLSPRVPNPPVLASFDNKPTLAYELFIGNYSPRVLSRIEVVSNGSVLKVLEGSELNKSLLKNMPWLPGWIFMWVELPGSSVPSSLSHRIFFTDGSSLQGGVAPVISSAPIILSPPVRGNDWLAGNGPSNFVGHRTTVFELQGKTYIGQRYAVDWVQYGSNGLINTGNGSRNEDYPFYGVDVLAVGDGVVVDTKDGLPDNVPFHLPAMSVGWAGGNYVTLDLGNNVFAAYAHLIPGSLRVKVGDRVRAGDVLGRLGSSGNSDLPHLHFQLMSKKDLLFGEGLPYVFSSYSLEGVSGNFLADSVAGVSWERGRFASPQARFMTMPKDGDVVSFPEACTSYSPEECPASCVVCPPCEVCSSISCQTEGFCASIGFNRTWWEEVRPK